ncbi:MAG: NADH-quinone oxidoreductase subunit C [Candidatus Gastranaerophilales bacterium]|nr:NADH-quinone oxidoreductase subunit C [Candidatus Gastranaerophilales bacterium]
MSFYEFLNNHGIDYSQEQEASGGVVLSIKKEDLLACCEILKTDRLFNYDMLLSVTGMDCRTHFEILYDLYSTRSHSRLSLKIKTDRVNPNVESLYSLYSSADWHERECFDLLGIEFVNHPNLERILLPKDWIGHPLRKDYNQEDERLCWNKR